MKITHLQYTIKWVKGKENIEADCLSRAPHAKPRLSDQLDEDEGAHIALVQLLQVDTLELRDERLKELRRFAEEDEEYKAVTRLVSQGQEGERHEWPESIRQYFPFKDDLYFDQDGFVVYNQRLFVPSQLRQNIPQTSLGHAPRSTQDGRKGQEIVLVALHLKRRQKCSTLLSVVCGTCTVKSSRTRSSSRASHLPFPIPPHRPGPIRRSILPRHCRPVLRLHQHLRMRQDCKYKTGD